MLAREGFRIFPLAPGAKTPITSLGGWKELMTTDESIIGGWFDTYPTMNYAVVCDDKHTVLDPDEGTDKLGNPKHGIQNLKDAEIEGFATESVFGSTFAVQTPRGGQHLYFNTLRPFGRSLGGIIPNVDVSGFNGYVVGPGSHTDADPLHNTAEGTYTIICDKPMALLPDWLCALMSGLGEDDTSVDSPLDPVAPIDRPRSIEIAKQLLTTLPFAVQGSGGDKLTLNVAEKLKDKGVSPEVCFDLMYSELLFPPDDKHPEGRSWNDCCEPEWSPDGLKTKIANAYRYGTRPPGIDVDAMSEFDGSVEDERPLADILQKAAIPDTFDTMSMEDGLKKIEAMLFTGSAFLDRKSDVYCIIPEWLPAQGMTGLLAKRGDGKSTVMEDLCLCIATDKPWNGLRVVPGYACVYLCGEDDFGMQRNLKAWREMNGCFPDDSRFAVAPAVPHLMDTAQVRQWAEVLKKRFEGRKVVVFVDTWHRATTGADQNNNQDMSKCLQNALELAKALQGCCVVAFHPPKSRNDTISGWGGLEDDGNAIWRIDDVAGGKKLSVYRIKGSRGEGNNFVFRIKEVAFGEMDDEGNELTGVVPSYFGGTGPSPENAKAEEDAMRSIILDTIYEDVQERKRGISFKELAELTLAKCAEDASLAEFLHHPSDVETVDGFLHQLFRPGSKTELGGAAIVVQEGRFVMRSV